MSFEIGGPSPSRKPVIREAQSMENNGGGGNLGYMQNRKKKKEKNEDEFETELQILEEDSFGNKAFKNENEENEKKPSFLDKIKGAIKKTDNN